MPASPGPTWLPRVAACRAAAGTSVALMRELQLNEGTVGECFLLARGGDGRGGSSLGSELMSVQGDQLVIYSPMASLKAVQLKKTRYIQRPRTHSFTYAGRCSLTARDRIASGFAFKVLIRAMAARNASGQAGDCWAFLRASLAGLPGAIGSCQTLPYLIGSYQRTLRHRSATFFRGQTSVVLPSLRQALRSCRLQLHDIPITDKAGERAMHSTSSLKPGRVLVAVEDDLEDGRHPAATPRVKEGRREVIVRRGGAALPPLLDGCNQTWVVPHLQAFLTCRVVNIERLAAGIESPVLTAPTAHRCRSCAGAAGAVEVPDGHRAHAGVLCVRLGLPEEQPGIRRRGQGGDLLAHCVRPGPRGLRRADPAGALLGGGRWVLCAGHLRTRVGLPMLPAAAPTPAGRACSRAIASARTRILWAWLLHVSTACCSPCSLAAPAATFLPLCGRMLHGYSGDRRTARLAGCVTVLHGLCAALACRQGGAQARRPVARVRIGRRHVPLAAAVHPWD